MQRRTPILFLALGFAAIRALHAQATIEGTVTLPKPTYESGMNQRYGAGPDVPMAPINPPSAVVYLEGDFRSDPKAKIKATAEMAQKSIAFAPDLLPVLVGSTVEFPNMDDTYHNVFSYSKSKRFDLGRYRKGETPGTVLFDKPGVISVHCEIHERMRGMILVLETPHFKKTDTDGHYRLEHLPVGHFLLKAWVSESDVREQPVELKANATLHVDFPAK
jgi:plastocyanin